MPPRSKRRETSRTMSSSFCTGASLTEPPHGVTPLRLLCDAQDAGSPSQCAMVCRRRPGRCDDGHTAAVTPGSGGILQAVLERAPDGHRFADASHLRGERESWPCARTLREFL